jgi:hypothetical protein
MEERNKKASPMRNRPSPDVKSAGVLLSDFHLPELLGKKILYSINYPFYGILLEQ